MNDFESNLKKALNDRVNERVGPRRTPPAFDALRSATSRSGGAGRSRWLIPLLAAAAVAAVAIGATAAVNATSNTHRVAPATPGPVQTATPTPTSTPTTTSATLPTQSPVVPSKATATPTPVMDANIGVYGDCGTPTIKPVEIRLACADNGLGVGDLRWTRWDSSDAQGIGTTWYNDSVPSHAQGHIHYFPNTRVTLSSPVPDIHGKLVWSKIQIENPSLPSWASGLKSLPSRPI